MTEPGTAPPRRRRWLLVLGVLWVLVAAAVFLLHGWLLGEITAQAERRARNMPPTTIVCRPDTAKMCMRPAR